MARLKGIANDLLGTFVSRNNDIDGYWGIGVLRSYADSRNESEVKIDLLNAESDPTPRSPIKTAKEKYRQWLINVLSKTGLDAGNLKRAEVNLRFTTFEEFPHAIRWTRGEPYVCTVALISNNGASYEVSKLSCCAPHDPKKEYRSTRTSTVLPKPS